MCYFPAMVKEAKPDQPSLEQRLVQLEQLVGRLESGDMPLDEAMKAFEQGVRLTRECQQALNAASQRVQILQQSGGQESLESFEPLNVPNAAV